MSLGATQGKTWTRADWLVLLALCLLTVPLFTLVILPQFREGASSDYPTHLQIAAQLNAGQESDIATPNRLHSWAVGVGLRLLGLPLEASALLANLVVYGLTWCVLYAMLRLAWGHDPTWPSRALLALLALALLTLGPLSLLWGENPGLAPLPTVYHSPTFAISRPLALLQTLLLARAFWRREPLGWPTVALTALISAASVAARPNYPLALGPALVLLALAWRAKRWRVDQRLLWLGGLLPMALVLILQYSEYTQYLTLDMAAEAEQGIALSPLGWYGWAEPNALLTVLRLALSLALPLTAWTLYPRASANDLYLPLMLPTTLTALLQAYLLVETGDLLSHGNWTWGLSTALFVAYALSVRLWLIQWRRKARWTWREVAFGLILAFHALSGVLYYRYALLIYWP